MRDSLELLEWPELFEHLLAECLTPYGVKAWQAEPFLPDVESIERHQQEVESLKILLMRYGDVTSETGLPDISTVVLRLSKEGLLTLSELRQLMRVLLLGGRLVRHFARNLKSEAQLENLADLLDEQLIPQAVLEYLEAFIEPDGELKDTASPQLANLRQRLRHQKQSLQQQMQAIFQNPEYAGALQSMTVTEREGRMVFPVKAEYKNKLHGVIHGASASGATVFIEPQPLIQLNNALQSLQADLEAEIERILRQISLHLHAFWEPLDAFLKMLGRLDRRLAAARLSHILDAHPVAIAQQEQVLDLKRARHPLLVLNNRHNPLAPPIVANDITLGRDDVRTLVITGPNTGGKTVLLKTIGLFAIMLRAGLHLPVGEHSRMSNFDPVLADIGDQQSIAQSLSTFSAHMERLKTFVADETDLSRGLVLIDEITAGTDPTEGAALARAILDELYQKGAITIVTTHLGELKIDAHQHAGFMNASVEFDPETLSPTYRLMLGVPGASNAITIAQKLGLKEAVIQKARAALSAPVRESVELLQEFELRNRQLEEELQKAKAFRLAAEEMYQKVEMDRQKLEDDKRQALKQFQQSLKGRIHDLENQVRFIRKDLQQAQADKNPRELERLNRRLQRVGGRADTIFAEARESLGEVSRLRIQDLKIGETVTSRQLELTGEIISIDTAAKTVQLQSGILRVTVPVADLQKPYQPRAKSQKPKPKTLDRPRRLSEGESVPDEPLDPSLSCDVRGQRSDEAILTVEKFLDDAVMSGYQAVALIHGVGTGALKKEIRRYLADSVYVKRFYPAQATQGGDGKTIVELSG
jgi:DNA mismatch repair protein MutS2